MNLNPETKLKDVVLRNPAAAAILENAGLDYCCGGRQTVADACLHAGVSSEELLARLAAASQEAGPQSKNWLAAPIAELTNHIVQKHHAYVRQAVPAITKHLSKVLEKHAAHHPELLRIAEHFSQLSRELMQHMQKEELILFPYLEKLAAATETGAPLYTPFFQTVQNPVAAMLKEHDSAGDLANEIRRESGNYTAPADGCTTYELAFRELSEFDHDLRQHVHLENNVLFPRGVEMESTVVYQ